MLVGTVIGSGGGMAEEVRESWRCLSVAEAGGRDYHFDGDRGCWYCCLGRIHIGEMMIAFLLAWTRMMMMMTFVG